MSEYVIINKTDIEKRISELETLFIEEGEYFNSRDSGAHAAYKKILSQSTPLIPEIEKAWEDGRNGTKILANFPFVYNKYVNKTSKDYISNLNLDI